MFILGILYSRLTLPQQFQPEGSEGHSSSIIDLFDSLRSPITFLEELEWEDEYQEARFFTSLSKVSPMQSGRTIN